MKEKIETLLEGIKEFRITKEGLADFGIVMISTAIFLVVATAISLVVDMIDDIFDVWLMRSQIVEVVSYALCLTPALKAYNRLKKIVER